MALDHLILRAANPFPACQRLGRVRGVAVQLNTRKSIRYIISSKYTYIYNSKYIYSHRVIFGSPSSRHHRLLERAGAVTTTSAPPLRSSLQPASTASH